MTVKRAKNKKILNDSVRMNVRVSRMVKDYLESESEALGISQSSLVAMAMQEYVDQKQVIKFTRELGNLVGKDGKIVNK